jgi:hypothetical protein
MEQGRTRARSLLTNLTAVVVVGVFGLMLGGPSARSAAPDSKDVRVVNDTTQPVPVAAQGTTAVNGTVGIDAANNGVVVTNSSAQPVPVAPQTVPIEPVHVVRTVEIRQGESTVVEDLFGVPDGKQLVLEYVSVFASNLDDRFAKASVLISDSVSGRGEALIPLSRDGGFGIGSEQVSLYGAERDRVIVELGHDSLVGNEGVRRARFTIIGRLFDAPS